MPKLHLFTRNSRSAIVSEIETVQRYIQSTKAVQG